MKMPKPKKAKMPITHLKTRKGGGLGKSAFGHVGGGGAAFPPVGGGNVPAFGPSAPMEGSLAIPTTGIGSA